MRTWLPNLKPKAKQYGFWFTGVNCLTKLQQRLNASEFRSAQSISARKGFDFDPESASELLMRRAVYGDVIEDYREYADGLQTICYCSSIKHSIAMADEFVKAGINAVHFDGNTPAAERRQIVPDCWCCILLRPTMSTALAIQQEGRALRPQPGKTAIILDHVGNYTRHGLPDDPREWSLSPILKLRVELAGYSKEVEAGSYERCKKLMRTFDGRKA